MSLQIISKQDTDPFIITEPAIVLVSEQFELYAGTNINESLQKVSRQLKNVVESYKGLGSGWLDFSTQSSLQYCVET